MSKDLRYPCGLCNEGFAYKWEHHEHTHSYNHHKKLSSRNRNFVHNCVCCQTTIHSIVDFADHIGTEKHKQALQEKINSIKFGESKGQQRAAERARNTNYQLTKRQRKQARREHQQMKWEARNSSYQDWQHQGQGQQNPGEYIQLGGGNGRGKPMHANSSNNWNRPFGYQYPYNQPNPQYSDFNTQYNDFSMPPPQPLLSIPLQYDTASGDGHHRSYSPRMPVSSSASFTAASTTTKPSPEVSHATASLSITARTTASSSTTSRTTASSSTTARTTASSSITSRTTASSSTTARTTASSKATSLPESSYSKSKTSPTHVSSSHDIDSKTHQQTRHSIDKSEDKPAPTKCDKFSETIPEKVSPKASAMVDASVDAKVELSARSGTPVSHQEKEPSRPSSAQGSSSATNQRRHSDSSNGSSKMKKLKITAPDGDVLRKVKQEPQEVNTKAKVKKKTPEAKRGSLHGLLQGRSTSRHLQYQLDKAVKLRRSGQGRNYNIETDSDTLGLPDSCELESVAAGDVGRVEALLGDMDAVQQSKDLERPKETEVNTPHTGTLQAASQSGTDLRFAATMDSTRATVNPSEYTKSLKTEAGKAQEGHEPAAPTPVVAVTKKRKIVSPPTPQPTKTKKKQKTAAQPKAKKTPKAKVTKAAKLKQTAITKTSKADKKTKKTNSSTSTVPASTAPVSMEECQLPTSTSYLQTEVEEKESVISQLLALTMREEKIRQELPELESSIKAMVERQQKLVEEQKEIEQNLKRVRSKRTSLHQEEEYLRKSRLDILTKAKDGIPKLPSTSGWSAQADAGPSEDLAALNTQYIGGFITSDAAEEERLFSNLHERVRHLSQSSDTESTSRNSVSSSKGLSKIEKKMEDIVKSQKRKSLQGANQMLYEGHVRPIKHLVVKGDFLYSSSGDHTLRRFDLKTGSCICTYYGHENAVKCFVVLSRQSEKLAIYSVDMDGLLLVFDVDTKTVLNRQPIGQSINCIVDAWGSLYLGLENGNIVSYSISDCSICETYHTDESGIVSMCTAQEGARRLIICGSYDGRVSVRDVKSALLLRQLPLRAPSSLGKQLPRCMTADDSRPHVYVCCSDTLRIYNYEKAVLLKEFFTGSDIRAMCFHREITPLLFTASQDGKICQFNTQNIEQSNTYQLPSSLLAITCKKGRVFAGDSNGLTTSFQITSRCICCRVGVCNLPYAVADQLLDHVLTAHLTEILAKHTCPWTDCTSTEHHKSTAALRDHISQSHLTS